MNSWREDVHPHYLGCGGEQLAQCHVEVDRSRSWRNTAITSVEEASSDCDRGFPRQRRQQASGDEGREQ
jgi:hypothetical protein